MHAPASSAPPRPTDTLPAPTATRRFRFQPRLGSWNRWLTLAALLLWLSRMWLITHRGDMDDDPLVFAASDPVSLMLLSAMVVGFVLAAVVR